MPLREEIQNVRGPLENRDTTTAGSISRCVFNKARLVCRSRAVVLHR